MKASFWSVAKAHSCDTQRISKSYNNFCNSCTRNRNMELWVGCATGALADDEYREKLQAAGFRVHRNRSESITSMMPGNFLVWRVWMQQTPSLHRLKTNSSAPLCVRRSLRGFENGTPSRGGSNYWLFAAALKYNVGVVPSVFLNIEMNALGVL